MKIADIHIDGFGVWNNLELPDLSGELTVLYGPNETGKTTLLEFVRAMFFGFASARRNRYLPPVRGGRPGGTMLVEADTGSMRITRHDDVAHGDAGELSILDSAGTAVDTGHLIDLLSGIDEPIYRNVFAVGLDELQYLRSLSDGDAATLLYDLSIGMDRVSLVEVLGELKQSRSRLLSSEDRPSQIVQLLSSRDILQSEINELGAQANRYWRLSASRMELNREITKAEADSEGLDRELKLLEAAAAVRGKWQERAAIDAQLTGAGDTSELPADGLARLASIQSRLSKRRSRWKKYRGQRLKVRRKLRSLPLNEPLWRQAARIEALAENDSWITGLETQLRDSERLVAQLQSQLADQGSRLGLGSADTARDMLKSSGRWLAPLKSAAKAVRQARRQMLEAKQEVTGNKASAESLRQEIQTTLAHRSSGDLNAALEKTGHLVSQLRRRIQLDDRLDNMARNKAELEESIKKSLDQQVLPGWQLAAFGAVFVVGVLLLISGAADWLYPSFLSGSKTWLAVMGLLAAGGAAAGKWGLERAIARLLESSQKQLAMLKLQIAQAKEERETLDEQLPSGGGHLVTRLQKAEKELAGLEELLPLHAKAQIAEQQSDSDEQRLHRAAADYKAARRRWTQGLASAGLPENLTPAQLRDLAEHGDVLGELGRKLEEARGHCDAKRKELQAVVARVDAMMNAAGLKPEADGISAQLKQLKRAAAEQEALFSERDQLTQRGNRLRRRQRKYRREILRLLRRKRSLMRAAGAVDEHDFRRRAEQWSRIEELRRRRDVLQSEIESALGQYSLESIERELSAKDAQPLDERLLALRNRASAAQTTLRGLFERRGDLGAQLKSLATDRRVEQKKLELASVKQRLKEALQRWQVLATTELALNEIKTQYETERQPEALREASTYLQRLTSGRYKRVWTPLDANVLCVDDSDGNPLSTEVLSRGTREQLFLSLRLALVSSYSRKGAALPLVLDDVLVNFDTERSVAAAETLRDFAASGHQLLVFTCHEHIRDMFASLDADCRELGSRASAPPRKKRRARLEPVAEAVVPPPAEEILEPVATKHELAEEATVEETTVDEPLDVPVVSAEPEVVEEPIAVEETAAVPAPEPIADEAPVQVDRPRRTLKRQRKLKPAPVAPRPSRWSAEEFDGELTDRVSPRWRENQAAQLWSDREPEERAGDEDSEAA